MIYFLVSFQNKNCEENVKEYNKTALQSLCFTTELDASRIEHRHATWQDPSLKHRFVLQFVSPNDPFLSVIKAFLQQDLN